MRALMDRSGCRKVVIDLESATFQALLGFKIDEI
jgi:hypothetical protein